MTQEIIIIPARMGSTRLANKPLADIAGKPMIIRVLEQAKKTDVKNILVAAGENEIVNGVTKNGFQAVLTDPNLASGTDRIYHALKSLKNKENFEFIVNLQGDLPTIEPKIISELLNFIKTSNYDIVTAVVKITDEHEKTNPNVVKAVVAWKNEKQGKALYFTRATAPHFAEDLYHHIGIYIYTKKALEKFINLPPSPLEKTEKSEQLRALENDMKIGVLKVDTIPLGVDTAEDLEKAIYAFKNGLI